MRGRPELSAEQSRRQNCEFHHLWCVGRYRVHRQLTERNHYRRHPRCRARQTQPMECFPSAKAGGRLQTELVLGGLPSLCEDRLLHNETPRYVPDVFDRPTNKEFPEGVLSWLCDALRCGYSRARLRQQDCGVALAELLAEASLRGELHRRVCLGPLAQYFDCGAGARRRAGIG